MPILSRWEALLHLLCSKMRSGVAPLPLSPLLPEAYNYGFSKASKALLLCLAPKGLHRKSAGAFIRATLLVLAGGLSGPRMACTEPPEAYRVIAFQSIPGHQKAPSRKGATNVQVS